MMNRSPKMILLSLALLYISKYQIDSKNQYHLWGVRILYLLSQTICIMMIVGAYKNAKDSNDPGLVNVREDLGFGQQGDYKKISIGQHDMKEGQKLFQRFAMGFGVTSFLHLYMGFVPPLVLQAVVQPVTLFKSPLFRVRVRKQKAWGELARPWMDPTMKMTEKMERMTESLSNTLAGVPNTRKKKKGKKN